MQERHQQNVNNPIGKITWKRSVGFLRDADQTYFYGAPDDHID